MKEKGMTISFIVEAESANYGEGVGNVTALKKMTRGSGDSYTYISRQALRFNIIQQMKVGNTPLELDGSVIQFHPDATIESYPEIDLFGYMKTSKGTKTRAAVARLSNAVALESFQADLDFLTNKGLFDRYISANSSKEGEAKKGGNIAQSEIHHSYYAYTITVDLDQVGIDKNDNVSIANEEKATRVITLLNTLKYLFRDIKGRRENLSPIFAIGGVYDIKNPFFENRIKVKRNHLSTKPLKNVLSLDEHIAEHTSTGFVEGIFENDQEITDELNATSISNFFKKIEHEINAYYNN